jgi:hypothetical protein
MALTALDLGLRGAVVGLFLVVCAVLLLRYTTVHRAASLGAALGVAGDCASRLPGHGTDKNNAVLTVAQPVTA